MADFLIPFAGTLHTEYGLFIIANGEDSLFGYHHGISLEMGEELNTKTTLSLSPNALSD